MIQIQQDISKAQSLEININKNCEVSFGIDVDSVKSDIEALEEKLKNPLSKYDKKNIKRVKDYLEKLLSRVSDDFNFELLWSVNGDTLETYPLELKYIPEYSIEMTDYIRATEGKLVRIDYRDVFKAIAAEIMYRDLDETMESMEEKLADVGITGIYPVDMLLKHFDADILNLSRIYKIGDSPYYTRDTKYIYEYFGKKRFKTPYYRDCIEYSIRHAIGIIVDALMNKLSATGLKYSLCGANESGIYFIVDCDNDIDIDNILNESAVVRAFGRRFEVKPKVTVF